MYDPLNKAVEKLWFSGVVVVAAVGNYGVNGAATTVAYAPGNDPFVISVGASDTKGTGWTEGDDVAAPWSAYGYTLDGFAKPDLGAPGRQLIGPVPATSTMADLDLLRDINNSYGHLAGDAVLKGIAEIFRKQLRHYDIPARFGGEEFAILLPETPPEQALEIAERIRRAVADRRFEVETSSEPIRATISLGVAGFPKDGIDPNELIHQADLAVYRAKLQGRNRVQGASSEPLLLTPTERPARLAAVPEDGEYASVVSRAMRHVLELRFGLAGATPKTLEEVGTELGVTRERVRQLESRALRELQAAAPDLRLYLRAE